MDSFHRDYSFQVSCSDMFDHPEEKLSSPSHVWHGVAVGWKKGTGMNIQPLRSVNERIAGIKISLSTGSLILLSLYAPTSGQDENFLESMSSITELLRVNSNHGDTIIIGADTNCSTKSSSRRQLAWGNFCTKHNLTILAPLFPTFHHHNGLSNSSIDVFAATDTLKLQVTGQYCTLDTPLNLSSHDPVYNSVCVPNNAATQESKFSNTYTDFNRQKVVWNSDKMSDYQQLADQALYEATNFWKTPESIPLLSTLISSLLVKCATMVFKTSSSNTALKLANKPSKKVRQAQAALRRSFNAWKAEGKPGCSANPVRQRYREARGLLQRLLRHESNLSSIKQNNYLMHLNKFNKSKIFAALKKDRGVFSNTMTPVLHTPVGTFLGDDVLEGLASDTEHLGKSNEGNSSFDQGFYKLCKLDNLYIFEFSNNNPVRIPLMTMSHLNKILHEKMKSGKACDVYQLTVEHLRNCGDKAKTHQHP